MAKNLSIILLLLVVLMGSLGACSGGEGPEETSYTATKTNSDLSPSLPPLTTSPSPSKTPVDLASISLVDSLANGKPTLAEFGRGTCVPCKKMKPILEELAAEYDGQINVVIVEVQNHNDLTRKYSIQLIPTQIFFNSAGEEMERHVGLYQKDDIVPEFYKLGMLKNG